MKVKALKEKIQGELGEYLFGIETGKRCNEFIYFAREFYTDYNSLATIFNINKKITYTLQTGATLAGCFLALGYYNLIPKLSVSVDTSDFILFEGSIMGVIKGMLYIHNKIIINLAKKNEKDHRKDAVGLEDLFEDIDGEEWKFNTDYPFSNY